MLQGKSNTIYLGNLNAKRDWGHAKDYVEAMWLMLQQDQAQDFVIATGKTTTVRDFVIKAFQVVGIELGFEGSNQHEIGKVVKCSNPDYQLEVGSTIIRVDPNYYRPTEVDLLIGDASKAFKYLNWKPKYDIDSLIEEMVLSDLKIHQK